MSLASRPDRAVLAIVAAFTALRLVLAAVLGLGVDEAYTLSVAHDLRLSYFDHPPLQYWIAHFFMPFLGDGRAARLPFIALFAASSWLLYRFTRLLFGTQAGIVAVLALNCSGFFTFGAGGWVLPDGPLIFALLAAALTLAREFFAAQTARPSALATWLHAGFWFGVAGLSKYSAVLIAAGLLLFLASVPHRRPLLAHPAPWCGALLALAMAAPVIAWNIHHGWISVGYQLGRARAGGGLHLWLPLVNILGQAIWMLPWIFVPMLIAAWGALRAGPAVERAWYCLCLALPAVVLFTLIPLWAGLGLPHWQMPGWLMLYPVLADAGVRRLAPARLRRFALICTALVVVLGGLGAAEAATGYGRLLAPRLFGLGDPTLAAFDWSQLAPELAARRLLRPGTFLITTSWIYAGRIDESLHDRVPVVVFGGSAKEFGLRYDPASFLGRDALLIAPADRLGDTPQKLRPYFDSLEELPPFALGRSGMSEIPLRLFLGKDLRAPLAAPPARR